LSDLLPKNELPPRQKSYLRPRCGRRNEFEFPPELEAPAELPKNELPCPIVFAAPSAHTGERVNSFRQRLEHEARHVVLRRRIDDVP